MTKKKRELIEIILDNVKPEDWPEHLPYAAQDKMCKSVYAFDFEPVLSTYHDEAWTNADDKHIGYELIIDADELCKRWNKTIVHRDEFMKRWNERNSAVDSEDWNNPDDGVSVSFADAGSPLKTQIGGDHYTKLSIQPMQYSMKNGLDPLQHTIIKYVTRFRDKAGIEDLEKAKHCIDMLIEHERSLM